MITSFSIGGEPSGICWLPNGMPVKIIFVYLFGPILACSVVWGQERFQSVTSDQVTCTPYPNQISPDLLALHVPFCLIVMPSQGLEESHSARRDHPMFRDPFPVASIQIEAGDCADLAQDLILDSLSFQVEVRFDSLQIQNLAHSDPWFSMRLYSALDPVWVPLGRLWHGR